MIQIEFQLDQQKIIIQAKSDETFQAVIDRYIQKTQIQLNSVYFISNGSQIKLDQTLENAMTELEKQNQKIKVLVNMLEDKSDDKKEVIIKSKDIICPKCSEPCIITLENCKIKLFGCVNNHITKDIGLLDFPETQKIDISKIICDKCKVNNKGESTDHKFYKCLTCKKNLCILCKVNHQSDHNVVRDDLINNICPEHNEQIIKFCVDCNLNTCFSCDEKHRYHETINLVDLNPNKNIIKNKLLQLKNEIETFKDEIKKAMMKLDKLKEALDIFYEINNDIFNKLEMKNRNYQSLENIELINNNEIYNRLKEINEMIDFKDNISSIIDLYDKIINNIAPKEPVVINNLTPTVKVVLLGEYGTGKTAILSRYINNTFEDNIIVTTGAYYNTKAEWFEEENQSIKLEIWDTSGREKNRVLNQLFYKDANVCILVYDVTRKESFDEIREYWAKKVKEFGRKDVSKKKNNINFLFSSLFGWK
jgi:small GTP-binding protein